MPQHTSNEPKLPAQHTKLPDDSPEVQQPIEQSTIDVLPEHSHAKLSPKNVMRLQQTVGNRAVMRLLAERGQIAQPPVVSSSPPKVQRMGVEDLRGLEEEEHNIYRDWVEWAKVYGGAKKSEEQVLAEYTIDGLKGALSEYTTNPWRRFIAEFAVMAREGTVPMEMYQVMMFDDIAKVKAPRLAFDFIRLAGIKNLNFPSLVQMLETYTEVIGPRGYPAPFQSKEQFGIFKEHITKLVVVTLGIKPMDICVQGSSLRKLDPHDVDIGVIVDVGEFERIGEHLLAMSGKGSAKKKTQKAIDKGKIDTYLLAFMTKKTADSRDTVKIFDLGNSALATALGKATDMKVQISAILAGSSFDTSPFMSFKE